MGAPAKRRREYAPHEIDAALTTLAFFGGNSARTSAETGIPQQTLHDWRSHQHRDRYLEIQEREGPKLEAIAAGHAREIILRAAETEHRILDRLAADDIDPDTGEALALTSKELSELAGALQRITTAKGINTTKLLELTGRPTSIVEHRDPHEEGLRLLKRYGIAIDATATEIPTGQLPASTTPEPQILPLPVESGGVNARDKSVSPAVQPPVD